jgi:glutamate-1-semialdehyde 2,1-aminomutase
VSAPSQSAASSEASSLFPESARLFEEALLYAPGGVNSGRRKIEPPIAIRRGMGAYLETVDGRRLIDYHAAYGPIILGHAYPAVVDQVAEHLKDGQLFGVGTTESEVELAKKIVEHVPSAETVVLANTGNEATLNAIRLARATTGRELLVKFQGSFNGSHDYMLRNVLSPPELIGERDPGSAGMLDSAVDSTVVCRFNDLDDVRGAFAEAGERIAAVVLEPILHNAPSIIPEPEFLPGLRRICDEHGALLIFDEVVTGFRHHIGGYQAICGVMPDLTALGKALANGFPIAAIAGRRELLERFTTMPDGDVFFGGTYNGNQVGVVAALATIAELENPQLYEHIFALGERMRSGLREIISELDIDAVVTGFGSLYVVSFIPRATSVKSYDDVAANNKTLQVRYRQELIQHGVFEMPENSGRNHISYSHTSDDIDRTLEIAEASLKATIRGQNGLGTRTSHRASQ